MDEDTTILLDRYNQGDVAALEKLVELYRRPLYAFILRMSDGREDADDIFQEVWFRAIKKMDSFRKGSLLSWLFRIAHNLIVDKARRNRRFVETAPSADGDEQSQEETLPDESRDPRQSTAGSDDYARVRLAVDKLPLEQREVFLMRVEGDLAFKQIAKIQKVSINTALARMQYALDKLRRELRSEYESEVEDQ